MLRHPHANFLLSAVVVATSLSTSLAVLALTGDSLQPIQIQSQQQSLDLKTNCVTFTGRVVVTQGTIDIRADKVIVIRSNNPQGQQLVEAYGHPATFYQLLDDQQPVKGQSQKMLYDAKKAVVTLQQQAALQRFDSHIKGDTITYDILKQQVHAYSAPNQRVKVVLQPDQLAKKPHKPNR